jgi:Cu/Ag efflux pump CusA
MIGRYQRLDRQGGEALAPEVVLRGAREHLVPLLTTALATLAAVLPFLFINDLPGLEVVRPMAGVIAGGVLTCTVFSLFVVPTLFMRFGTSWAPILESTPYQPMQLAGAGTAAD